MDFWDPLLSPICLLICLFLTPSFLGCATLAPALKRAECFRSILGQPQASSPTLAATQFSSKSPGALTECNQGAHKSLRQEWLQPPHELCLHSQTSFDVHVTIEVEAGLTRPQTKEGQGFLATPRTKEKSMEQILSASLPKEPSLPKP